MIGKLGINRERVQFLPHLQMKEKKEGKVRIAIIDQENIKEAKKRKEIDIKIKKKIDIEEGKISLAYI